MPPKGVGFPDPLSGTLNFAAGILEFEWDRSFAQQVQPSGNIRRRARRLFELFRCSSKHGQKNSDISFEPDTSNDVANSIEYS